MTTEECEKSQTCERHPADCKSSDTCETLIMYKNNVVHGTLDVILATSSVHAYLSWAQNNANNKMVRETLRLLCNGTTFWHFWNFRLI